MQVMLSAEHHATRRMKREMEGEFIGGPLCVFALLQPPICMRWLATVSIKKNTFLVKTYFSEWIKVSKLHLLPTDLKTPINEYGNPCSPSGRCISKLRA